MKTYPDLYIWALQRERWAQMPNGGERLTLTEDGKVAGSLTFAQFPDKATARRVLKAAGFVEISRDVFKAR